VRHRGIVTTAGRCAELSAAAAESLAATAVTVHNWLLVEVGGTWPRDVADAAGLDGVERDAIRAWLDAVPLSRLLFIRRPGRARDERLVYVVRGSERYADVRRIALASTRELKAVDLARDGERVDAQLVLVCGHGTRDACCALRGSAVFGMLESVVGPDELWLSSHQGGHRFAANVLVLPEGIQLGRVAPEDATQVVGTALAGRVALEHYRGRTAYSPREQAAERAVREAAGLTSLSDLALEGDDGHHVRFVSQDGMTYRAVVEETAGPAVPASCGAAPEPQALRSAQLV
jgi:hypothetical protein